ncbi:response regulator [Methanococcoides sp. AM1]|uniref:response regulator n=1 Tax=Methanococcoides sp. AM1 TaxID=1201011 RepID=UPI001FCE33F6|nr:response regulator [Methanococcoides sp. AM1]
MGYGYENGPVWDDLDITMKSKKIVVVEDEMIVGMMIKLKLEKMGYSVTGFASKGKEAISMVGAIHPDLILMDIRLKGGMDGVETAMKIRESYSIPIVFITADSSKVTRERASRVGHQGYLTKPFMDEDLGDIVHSVFYNSVDGAGEVNVSA